MNERPADNNATSPILAYIKRGPLPEERRYWKSLLDEDDLGAVVRTSTFLESHLETILRRHFLDPTARVNIRGIAYMRRAELAWAFGEFDANLVKTLKILDELWSSPGLVDTQLSLSKMGGGVFSAKIETKSWQATGVHA